MDYRTTIMELEYELNNTISEDTLYKIISEKLKKVENSQSHIYESLDEKDKKLQKHCLVILNILMILSI
jgi:hypothetical protein